MSAMPVADILQDRVVVNSEAMVRGWVRTRRDPRAGFSFLAVHGDSCFGPVQAVISNSLSNCNQEVLRSTTGCSVVVTNKVVASQGQGQSSEIQATSVEVAGWVEDPDTYPMTTKRHSIEYLREVAHLCSCTNLIGAVAHVHHTLAQALYHSFDEQGFFWISTPLITASDIEDADEIFRVPMLDPGNLPHSDQDKVDFDKDLFGKESFLTVSGQLSSGTCVYALPEIYTFGSTFRTESSSISHHLAKLWTLEPEVVFANLDDITGLAGAMLKCVFKAVLEERADDMQFSAERVDKGAVDRLQCFIVADFAQVDYTDAITILENCGERFEDPVYWSVGLSPEYERYLAEEYFKAPVVVKNYPRDIKAFYIRLSEGGKTVTAMDVLAPGIGEIIGGSQREGRLDVLDVRMVEMGFNKEDYWQYRDLRHYGTVPRSGSGLDFEHLITYVIDVQNIRDVIPFPCTPRNTTFQILLVST